MQKRLGVTFTVSARLRAREGWISHFCFEGFWCQSMLIYYSSSSAWMKEWLLFLIALHPFFWFFFKGYYNTLGGCLQLCCLLFLFIFIQVHLAKRHLFFPFERFPFLLQFYSYLYLGLLHCNGSHVFYLYPTLQRSCWAYCILFFSFLRSLFHFLCFRRGWEMGYNWCFLVIFFQYDFMEHYFCLLFKRLMAYLPIWRNKKGLWTSGLDECSLRVYPRLCHHCFGFFFLLFLMIFDRSWLELSHQTSTINARYYICFVFVF